MQSSLFAHCGSKAATFLICMAALTFAACHSEAPDTGDTRWETSERMLLSKEAAAQIGTDRAVDYRLYVAANGKRTAYFVQPEGTLVIDGKPIEGRAVNTKYNTKFSDDSTRFVYTVEEGGMNRVVVDGIPGKPYGSIGSVVVSRDGTHLGYVVNDAGVAVVDGRESKKYGFIGPLAINSVYMQVLVFSDDGKHYGFVTPGNGQPVAVIDGEEHRLDGIPVSLPTLSNSGRWACVVFGPEEGKEGDRDHVVLNGKALKGYKSVGASAASGDDPVVLSADGKHYAYSVWDEDQKWYMVLDGEEDRQNPLHWGVTPVVSQDGNHVAFVAKAGDDGEAFVLDRTRQDMHKSVHHPALSPNGQRFAYAATDSAGEIVVVDGKAFGPFGSVYQVVFSGDGRGVAWAVSESGGKNWRVFVNGQERKRYDRITALAQWKGAIQVTGPGSFGYVAISDGAYYWVDERRAD